MQVFHDAALLHDAEKTGGGEAVFNAQAADGVAAAVEGAAKRRDGQRVGAFQHKVVVEHDLFAARPGVERAGAREGLKVLLGLDMDGAVAVSQRARDGQKRQQQQRAQRQRAKAM